ncbi:hypothetical protein TCAL_04836 [Tigriopus californicus]|uniref:Mediator of DNA damage checkpoint protein 1 n=1 Tax=Tigriopus californicus TaxID=6832 RepID=A0A553NY90_TIGCA|nr:mediator of DNA damage checkpoint protein 1-like isoform X2 [Tigriopus californicus]TRY70391.1 hypothetical protein TCAL_04836 [Tigriopus californicus]|eukprot:TCALIF_04836-PA protein Name:"Similar to MDC1 Mediator of DNA damage checkpoint protein 1 (Sus scrofa)" AED:0.00 eAED:0.00 QI:174/1/1/1/0.62/0.55/9/993/1488
MDLPCTQLMGEPEDEEAETRADQERRAFEQSVFGSLVGADADGRKERVSRNPLRFLIRGGPNKIGRDPTQCQIVIENQTLSRVHAVLEVVRDERGEPSYLIRDENSSNRSFRNGVQMRSGAMYVLEGGEQLRFGEVRFVFQVSGQEEDEEEEEEEDETKGPEDTAEEVLPLSSESTLVCQTPTPAPENQHNDSSVSATPVKINVSQVPETPMGPPARVRSPSSGMGTPIGIIPESPSVTPNFGSLNGSASFVAPTQPADPKTPLALSEIFEQETQAISVSILDLPTQKIEASSNILDEDTQKISTENPSLPATNGVSFSEASAQKSESKANDNNGEMKNHDDTVSTEEEDVFNVATQESVVDRGESFYDNQNTVPQRASDSQPSNPASQTLKSESPTQPLHANEHPMNNSSSVSVENEVNDASTSNDGNESDMSENLLAACETDGDVKLEDTSSQGPSSSTPVKQNTSDNHEEEVDDVATQILAEDDEMQPLTSRDSSVEITDKRVLKDFSELMNSSTNSGIASTAYLDQSASTLETTETLADTRIINSMSSEGPDHTLEKGPSNGEHGLDDEDIKSDESSDDEIIQSSQLSTNRTNFNSITMEMTKPVGKITSQEQLAPSSQSKDPIEKSTGTMKRDEPPIIQAIDQEHNEESSGRNLSPDIYDVEAEQDDENQGKSQKPEEERPDSEPLDLPCTQVLAEALSKELNSNEEEEENLDVETVSNIERHIKKEKGNKSTIMAGFPDKNQEGQSVKKEKIQPEAEEPLRRSSRATKRSTRLSSFVSDVPELTNRAKRNSVPLITPKAKESNSCPEGVNLVVANEDSIASKSAMEQKTSDDASVIINVTTAQGASVNDSKKTARKKQTTKPKKSKASFDLVNVSETSGPARKQNSPSVPLKTEMKETGTTTSQDRKSKRLRATPISSKTLKLEQLESSSPARLEDNLCLSHKRTKKGASDETSSQIKMENGILGAKVPPFEVQDQKAANSTKRPARRSSSNSTANRDPDDAQTSIKPQNSTKRPPKRLRSSLRSSATSSAGAEEHEDSSGSRSSLRTSRQLRKQTCKQSIVPQKQEELPSVADMPSKNESEPKSTPTVRKVEESLPTRKGTKRGSIMNNSWKQKETNGQERRLKRPNKSIEQVTTEPGSDDRVEVKRLSRRKTGQTKDQSNENKSAQALEVPDVAEQAVVPGRSTRSTRRCKQAQPKAVTCQQGGADGTSTDIPETGADRENPKAIGIGSCPKSSLKRANKRANSLDQMEDSVSPSKKKSRNLTTLKKVETRRDSTSSVESVSLRQRGEIKVMFTGYEDSKDQKIVSDLGGSITESLDACTVLVTDKIRRTAKFLCMVARGMPIVSPLWLHSSKESRTFQDPWLFLITDRDAEKKWDFVLQTTLRNARTKEHLLSGFKIYATQSVMPSGDQLKEIVESAGGQVLKKLPKRVSEQVIVIACAKDHKEALAARDRGFQVFSNEIILTGFLRHKLDFKAHQLKL